MLVKMTSKTEVNHTSKQDAEQTKMAGAAEKLETDQNVNKSISSNVVIVAMKKNLRSRELLTWTLAKFANPGDQVIALHISVAPVPYTVKNKYCNVDNIFDSVVGVYDDFCNIKKINLQLIEIQGITLRRSLVEEAQKHNAAKLILGSSGIQLMNDSSFALGRYCSKRLPCTCSVMVVHHGRVVYEKKGTMRKLSDKNEQLEKQESNMPEDLKSGRKPPLYRSMSSPFHFLLPYKYIPPLLHSGRFHSVDFEKPAVPLSDSHTSIKKHRSASLQSRKLASYLENGFSEEEQKGFSLNEKPAQRNVLSKLKGNQKLSCKIPKRPEAISPSTVAVSHTKKTIEDVKRNDDNINMDECGAKTLNDNMKENPVGWPLLHRSISLPNLEDQQSQARNMSVVEWVLQLPDRPAKMQTKSRVEVLVSNNRGAACTGLAKNKVARSIQERCLVICKDKSCETFRYSELQKATDNFSKGNIIGEGGCSIVYKGILSDGRIVAVKCLNTSPDTESVFLTEIEIVSGLRHGSIVQLLGYCIHNNQQYLLVYNFAPLGNLEQKLHGKDETVLPWNDRYKIAVGVAEALLYLHNCKQSIIHRDVKTSNILLLSDFSPQLADFGLSKWAPSTAAHITCSDVLGTFGYLAPEYFMYGRVSEKTDVFSFGVVLLELVSGRHPIATTKTQGQENLVVWAKPYLQEESRYGQVVDPRLEGKFNQDQLKHMMIAASHCLHQSPYLRLPMSKILQAIKGEHFEIDITEHEDCMFASSDEGFGTSSYDESDMKSHLALALCGMEDDGGQSMDYTNSNKFIEKYLQERYSRSNSFNGV